MIQFWFLWLFISIVVVIVAFTLRKERDDMPRTDILRAVESGAGSMGLAEKAFLWAFSWLDTRFRIQDYWGMSRDSYHHMHRQMPLTHAEKYKLRIIWYWYPLYCLGGISFLAFVILVISGTILGLYYVPGGDGTPSPAYLSMEFIMVELPFGYIMRSIHHWGTHFMVASVFLHMCRVYFTGAYRNPREFGRRHEQHGVRPQQLQRWQGPGRVQVERLQRVLRLAVEQHERGACGPHRQLVDVEHGGIERDAQAVDPGLTEQQGLRTQMEHGQTIG